MYILNFTFSFTVDKEIIIGGVVLKVEDYYISDETGHADWFRYNLRLNCKSVVLPKKGKQKFCMECYLIKRFRFLGSDPSQFTKS